MAGDVFDIVGSLQAGQFLVEAPVAEGGFAVVYKARHETFRAMTALKCLKVPPGLEPEQREQFLEKFRSESELLFRLSALTSAVVRPLHVGILEHKTRFVPFLAMEWLEGESLEDLRMARNRAGLPPLTLVRLVQMLAPVAQALEQAHALPGKRGLEVVVHCDLKPENLFLTSVSGNEQLKILDFGIARVRKTATTLAGHKTAGDQLAAFTPAFAAPEQWLPKRFGTTGPWTDVYALALTLVTLARGREVIEGEPDAMMGTTIDPVRRPTPRNEGLTVEPAVEAAFARALAVDPRERAPSIRVFWTELERALGLTQTFVLEEARAEAISASRSIPPRADLDLLPDLELEAPRPQVAKAARPPSADAVMQMIMSQEKGGLDDEMQGGLSVALARRPEPIRPSTPRPESSGAYAVGVVPRTTSSQQAFWSRLRAPLTLAAVALIGRALAGRFATEFSLGPLDATWGANLVVAIAGLWALARLLSHDDR
jgi:eukaryotic-like serine/threonine-protein kinase